MHWRSVQPSECSLFPPGPLIKRHFGNLGEQSRPLGCVDQCLPTSLFIGAIRCVRIPAPSQAPQTYFTRDAKIVLVVFRGKWHHKNTIRSRRNLAWHLQENTIACGSFHIRFGIDLPCLRHQPDDRRRSMFQISRPVQPDMVIDLKHILSEIRYSRGAFKFIPARDRFDQAWDGNLNSRF